MKTVAILGAGKIGKMVCHLLQGAGDYTVRVGDSHEGSVAAIAAGYPNVRATRIDFSDDKSLDSVLKGAWAVVSCAPYHCNPVIADRARALGLHYFDLTEDVAVTNQVREIAERARTAFAPQCGLAPGFITIVANHLVRKLTDVQDLRLRVGALPRYPSNRLKYNLTWSTEGLINEYCNPCEVILDGKLTNVEPLENLENLTIDGVEYEAFNTSGGLGTLAESLQGKVRNLNYKTIRFPGHCDLLKLLLHDLKLKEHQDELAAMFERALPGTFQDQIVVFVAGTGTFRGRYTESTYAKTILHRMIDDENWSGIQITTAAGVCAVVDMIRAGKLPQQGFLRMEQVDYPEFLQNRFGRYYA